MSSSFVPSIRRLLANPFLKYGLLISGAVGLVLAACPGILSGLFRADQFMPHATCYLRNPQVIFLHVASDLVIGLSYVSISATLGYLVHKASKDIPFHWMLLAFGLFIITCGFTHFMEVWTVWIPLYWLGGYVKLICAVASVATAIALYFLVPKIFALIHEMHLSAQRRVELQNANRELEAFAYSVSHDLRAPLRAIQGMSLAMVEDHGPQLEPGAHLYLERIMDASKRMDLLIRDLLEYTRVSRTEVELSPVQLRLALEQARVLVSSDAEQSKALIEVEGPMLMVQANHVLLRQILANLLGNAIKFVKPGDQPRVRVTIQEMGDTARISVSDNGIGIAPEYQEKIFQIFERLHSVNEYPGTGIGLAIVKKAMGQMKGELGLESNIGKGSCFWIQLPTAKA